MDIDALAEAVENGRGLPDAEARFVERVETARAKLEADEIEREEYYERVRRASECYRRAEDSG